jgi:hypothetical protein
LPLTACKETAAIIQADNIEFSLLHSERGGAGQNTVANSLFHFIKRLASRFDAK